MKKVVSLVVVVMLVVALSATSVFADSFPSIMEVQYGTGTVTYTDDGFILDGSGSAGFAVTFSSYNTSSRGSCSVTFDHGLPTNSSGNIIFQPATNATVTYSNLVGCFQLQNENVIRAATGTTYCSFDFEIVNPSSSKLPRFSSGSSGSNSHYVATWAFNYLYLDNDPVVSDVVGERFNFSIPTGYALLIQGECDILERDYAIYNSWNFYQNDARRVNGSRERVISTGNIVDGFSFDHNLTYAQSIQWIPRNANLFGSSTNYDYSDHTTLTLSSGSTFLISNPQYIGTMENAGNVQTKENNVPLTGTIYMEYSTRPTIKYIALESQIDFNQVGVYYNVFKPDVYEEEASTTTDGTDVIVTPDYTGTTVPPDGGNNGQPPYNPDETVEGVLSNFINSIRSLISTATQAISDLVNTGSGFMQSIATMFTWLPSPLLSVIIGGLTILIVVGVLKVLWR